MIPTGPFQPLPFCDSVRCINTRRRGTMQGHGPRGMHDSSGIRDGQSSEVCWAGDMLGQKCWGQLVPVHSTVSLKLGVGGRQRWARNGGLSQRARSLGGLLRLKGCCRRLGHLVPRRRQPPGREPSFSALPSLTARVSPSFWQGKAPELLVLFWLHPRPHHK